MTNLHTLNEHGYILLDDKEVGIDMADLSRATAKFLADGEFASLDGIEAADDLLRYVSNVHAKETDNKKTARIYQILPTVPVLLAASVNDKLLSCLNALGIETPSLGTFPMVRIDRPGQTKFLTPWHQDHWFSFTSQNSVTIWAPMGHVTDKHGMLRVIPGSHRNGVIQFKEYAFGHEPFEPAEPINEAAAIDVFVPFGKVLLFRQQLLHKSGFNSSEECRVTLQIRYNDMHGQPHPFSTVGFASSQHVLESQAKWLRA